MSKISREGDTLFAILTVAAIVLAAVLAVKGVEKLRGEEAVLPNTAESEMTWASTRAPEPVVK